LIRWFACLTAVNFVGVLVLALALLAPGVVAYVLWPRASVELKLVPVVAASKAHAQAARASGHGAEERIDVPAGFRTPDLSPRPWEELPGGEVRFRE